MTWSSTVKIVAVSMAVGAKVWSPIENAKRERSSILEPSVKRGIASGKEYRISEKRERYTEGSVERWVDLHYLRRFPSTVDRLLKAIMSSFEVGLDLEI